MEGKAASEDEAPSKELAKAEQVTSGSGQQKVVLDPYAKASLDALRTRNEKKRDEKAEEARIAKRPASKVKKEVQREVKKGVKDEITEVPKAQIMKMMPKATNPDAKVKPVHYWGGVIYTAVKMKKFRALNVRGDEYSECSRQ